jgi:hypothetical protein
MFIENNNIIIRRSERIHKKYNRNRNEKICIFKNEMNLLEDSRGKKKIVHYNNICNLFIKNNDALTYNMYNIRIEKIYDKIMRDMLKSLKICNNDLTDHLIVDYRMTKKEEYITKNIFKKTIHFIETYLNKKTNQLYKTMLNEDVISYIISFL